MTPEKKKDRLLLYRQLDWQYKISDYSNKSLKVLQKALQKSKSELFDEIGFKNVWLSTGREEAYYKHVKELSDAIGVELREQILSASTESGVKSVAEYNDILSFNGKVAGFNTVAISPAQMQALVLQAEFGGAVLNDWIDATKGLIFNDDMKTDLMAGVFKGEGSVKLANRLSENYGMFERDAESLARTFIAGSNNHAADMVYKKNKDIVNKVEWSATLEMSLNGRATCLRCASLDGRRWNIDEEHPTPPLHLRCRCFMLPVTKSYKELGLDIPEIDNQYRPFTERDPDNRTIKAVGKFSGNFEKFLKSRPKKYQVDLLGPNRYKMWKNGKYKFKDLIDKNGNLRLLKKNKTGDYIGLEKATPHKKIIVKKKPVVIPPKLKPKTIPNFVPTYYAALEELSAKDSARVFTNEYKTDLIDAFNRHAKKNDYGVELKLADWERLEDNFRENSVLQINFSGDRGGREMLSQGKLKNQFELGESAHSGGALSNTKNTAGYCRDSWESTFSDGVIQSDGLEKYNLLKEGSFLPKDLAEKRPVYGYVKDALSDDGRLNGQYGEITFQLKDSVKKRVTLTSNNSSLFSGRAELPKSPLSALGTIDNPAIVVDAFLKRSGRPIKLLSSEKQAEVMGILKNNEPMVGGFTTRSYVETQIYGGIDIKRDVEKIIAPRKGFGSDLQVAKDLAKKYNKPLEILE